MQRDAQLPCRFIDVIAVHRLPSHVTVTPFITRHPFHECIYVRTGIYYVTVSNRRHRLTAGQAAVFAAGTEHHDDMDAPFRGETPGLEMSILQWAARDAPETPMVLPSLSPRIPQLLDWISDIDLTDSAPAPVLDAIVFAFLNELEHSSTVGRLVRLVDEYMIGYIRRTLRTDLREKVSLDAFAKSAGLSKFHFIREFKRQAGGRTPMEYVQEFRAAKAQEFLAASNMSLTEIAHRLGFGSRNYLANFLKRHVGSSARKLRTRSRSM